MKIILRFLFLILLVCFLSQILFGQECNYPKLYLHLDKTLYFNGENIFFKAYTLNGFIPDESATVLKVALIDTHNTLKKVVTVPMVNGLSVGSIQVDNDMNSGVYRIDGLIMPSDTAQTNLPVFSKTIFISPWKYQAMFPIRSTQIDSIDFYIYPEWKSEGKYRSHTEYFFKAKDYSGIPVDVNGVVFSDIGDTVCHFSSIWQGRGRFTFTKDSLRQYFVKITGPFGKTLIQKLPELASDKLRIITERTNKGLAVTIINTGTLNQTQGEWLIKGFVEGVEVFTKTVIDQQTTIKFNIPLQDLPSSAIRLLVETKAGVYLGGKYVFLNSDLASSTVHVEADSIHYSTQKESSFVLKWADSLKGTISISVTNAGQILPFLQKDMYASLLLPSALSQKIDIIEPLNVIDLQERMDLMIATAETDSGLRTSKVNCFVSDTGFISFSGYALDNSTRKPLINEEIKLIFSDMDSTGISIQTIRTDKNGAFKLSKLVFEGIGTFRYRREEGMGNDILIIIDSNGFNKMQSKVWENTLVPTKQFVLTSYDDWRLKRPDLFNGDSNTGIATLIPVVVRSALPKPLDRVNKKYTKGVFTSMIFARSLDFINDPPSVTGGNILDYLVGRVNGLLINPATYKLESRRGASYSKSDVSAQPPIRLFLNEQETSVNFLTLIRPSDVALVKYFPPGNSPLSGMGMAGILAIYTRKYDDYLLTDDKKWHQFKVKGFDKPSTFEEDGILNNTSTLYWNPMILLDGVQNEFRIRFKNRFGFHRVLVTVNGLTNDGRLIYLQKIVE